MTGLGLLLLTVSFGSAEDRCRILFTVSDAYIALSALIHKVFWFIFQISSYWFLLKIRNLIQSVHTSKHSFPNGTSYNCEIPWQRAIQIHVYLYLTFTFEVFWSLMKAIYCVKIYHCCNLLGLHCRSFSDCWLTHLNLKNVRWNCCTCALLCYITDQQAAIVDNTSFDTVTASECLDIWTFLFCQ